MSFRDNPPEFITSYNSIYVDLMWSIIKSKNTETNKRTGHKIHLLDRPYTYCIDLRRKFPLLTLRKVPVKFTVLELCWFLSGSSAISDIPWDPLARDHFAPNYVQEVWRKFAEVDGHVHANVGCRWFYALRHSIEKLMDDPTSRQALSLAWNNHDIKATIKNVPCPFGFQLTTVPVGEDVRKLNFTLYQRSQDVIVGLPHDALGYALLAQFIVAYWNSVRNDIRLELGFFTHNITHPHIYDVHKETAEKLLDEWKTNWALHCHLVQPPTQVIKDKNLLRIFEQRECFPYVDIAQRIANETCPLIVNWQKQHQPDSFVKCHNLEVVQ